MGWDIASTSGTRQAFKLERKCRRINPYSSQTWSLVWRRSKQRIERLKKRNILFAKENWLKVAEYYIWRLSSSLHVSLPFQPTFLFINEWYKFMFLPALSNIVFNVSDAIKQFFLHFSLWNSWQFYSYSHHWVLDWPVSALEKTWDFLLNCFYVCTKYKLIWLPALLLWFWSWSILFYVSTLKSHGR